MKYVVNKCYGGFDINKEFAEAHNLDRFGDDDDVRTNKALISAIERGENVCERHSNLIVVEIPDNATDWELDEDDDGFESITYVVDGKINHV